MRNLSLILISTAVAATALSTGRAAETAGSVNLASPAGASSEADVNAFEQTFTNHLGEFQKRAGKASGGSFDLLWGLGGVTLLAAVVGIRYLPGLLAARDATAQARLAANVAAAQFSSHNVEEGRSFSQFADTFSSGPFVINDNSEKDARIQISLSPRDLPPSSAAAPAPVRKSNPLHEFFTGAEASVASLQKLLQDVTRAAEPESRQKLLAEVARKAGALKAAAGLPALLPVWKVAAALEALLEQAVAKPEKATPSMLRTAADAVDLIQTLAKPGTRADLTEDPPIRILAVDDDPISRHAIAFALKKALNLPELAHNGHGGLELAQQNSYDAIFLDVEMPGMTGFELCAKIRETELNQKTPVVFITRHCDFQSRAKSAELGGHELIGKPFQTFEVALKALGIVIRRRLESGAEKVPAPELAVFEE